MRTYTIHIRLGAMDGSLLIRCMSQAQQMSITLISLMRKKLVPMEGTTRPVFIGWNP